MDFTSKTQIVYTKIRPEFVFLGNSEQKNYVILTVMLFGQL